MNLLIPKHLESTARQAVENKYPPPSSYPLLHWKRWFTSRSIELSVSQDFKCQQEIFATQVKQSLAVDLALRLGLEGRRFCVASPVYLAADMHSVYMQSVRFESDWQVPMLAGLERYRFFDATHWLGEREHLIVSCDDIGSSFFDVPTDTLGKKVTQHLGTASETHRRFTELQMMMHELWDNDARYPNALWLWDVEASAPCELALKIHSSFWSTFSSALDKNITEHAQNIYVDEEQELLKLLEDRSVQEIKTVG